MKNLHLLACAVFAAIAFSACGGGSGSAPSNTIVTPPTTTPVSGDKATASLSFTIPRSGTVSSFGRAPLYLSPATDKVTFIVDNSPVVVDQAVVHFNDAGDGHGKFTFGPNNSESIVLSYDGTNPAYFAVNIALTVTPGLHKFGVVILSGTPAYVLSEGQGLYTLAPGPNNTLAPLQLRGVVATGYVECDTATQNTDTTGKCNNYANFTPSTDPTYPGGTYHLTAVAGDFNGFPIVYQAGLSFDNPSFSVTATDTPAIVSVSAGPWDNPGNHLTGPSGGWVAGSNFVYGQAFTATCLQPGTAHIALMLNANGGTFQSPDGSPDLGKYPPNAAANQTLPQGINNAQNAPRVTVANVNCTATGTIPVQ